MSVLIETRRPRLIKARCTCKAVIGVAEHKVGPKGVVVRCPKCEKRVRVRRPKAKARRKIEKPPIGVPVAEFQKKADVVDQCGKWHALLGVMAISLGVLSIGGMFIHPVVALALATMAGGAALASLGVGIAAIYHSWDFAKQADDSVTMSPAKAAFLMLVPVFNIYWAFRAIGGLGKQYRKIAKRHNVRVKDNNALAISIPVLAVAGIIPFIGPVLTLIGGICMMVLFNNLGKSANAIAKQAA